MPQGQYLYNTKCYKTSIILLADKNSAPDMLRDGESKPAGDVPDFLDPANLHETCRFVIGQSARVVGGAGIHRHAAHPEGAIECAGQRGVQ